MSALWDGARQLSGKKRRAPPALAPVGMNGVPARTTREQAMCWQAKFLEEFGGNGGVVTDAALLEQVRAGRAAVEQAMPAAAQLPQELKQAVLPCSREAWTYAHAGAFRGMALRRAVCRPSSPKQVGFRMQLQWPTWWSNSQRREPRSSGEVAVCQACHGKRASP